MQHDKRKKINQQRRKVADAGVVFTVHEGAAIDDSLWDFFHRCYTSTYRDHGSTPYLTRSFFAAMAQSMAEHWVMFVARVTGEPIAMSLIALDRERRAAFGRYWGATRFVDSLHFEACYYQPLQWCISQGIQRFEGGAQGEHKMARGLLPRPLRRRTGWRTRRSRARSTSSCSPSATAFASTSTNSTSACRFAVKA